MAAPVSNGRVERARMRWLARRLEIRPPWSVLLTPTGGPGSQGVTGSAESTVESETGRWCLLSELNLILGFGDPGGSCRGLWGRRLLMTLKDILLSAMKVELGASLNFSVEFVDTVPLWVLAGGSLGDSTCGLDVSG